MIAAGRSILLVSTLFAAAFGCASTRASTDADPHDLRVEIRLAHESTEEKETRRQLGDLLKRYDLEPWRFTSTIIIDEEDTPHSHPVLTLHTRHLRDELLLLSTYIHEQSHWYLTMNKAATSSAVKDLKELFPGLPVGYPDGAENLESSYEHIVVIMFERQGLIDLAGELAAHQALEFWATDHYRAVYRLVLNERRKIREVLQKHQLNPPSRRHRG